MWYYMTWCARMDIYYTWARVRVDERETHAHAPSATPKNKRMLEIQVVFWGARSLSFM